MNTEPEVFVAITGAGIVGVTLAHALLEREIPVRIYEASSTIRTTGGGINATEAGVRALRLCGKPCYEAFAQVATSHHRDRPELFWSITQGDQVVELASKGEFGSMNRIKFLESLASRLPDGIIKFSSKIKEIQEKESRVELRFEDESIEIADIVLGCDGIHSMVRDYVVGPGYQPSFSHNVICRGPVPAKDVEALVGEGLGKGSQVGIGNGDGFVLYPVDDSVVNFGYYYHDPDPWPHWPNVVRRWTKEELLEKMRSKNPKPDAKHFALVDLLKTEIIQWGIWHQEIPLPGYSKGKVAILGDAAHASAPFLSTGAGMGYEDVFVCVELIQAALRENSRSPAANNNLDEALNIYSEIRRERSQYMVLSSFDAGKTLMGAQLGFSKAAADYARRNHEVWYYDISMAAESALSRLYDTFQKRGT